MQFKRSRELKRTRIEIIPMIDTMFFLLVFFMLSSLSLVRLNTLPVNLASSSGNQLTETPPLVLSVTGDGSLFLNNQPINEGEMQERLKEAGAKPDASLLINADEKAPNGTVVKAMNAARAAGINRFSLATSTQ